MSVLETGTVLKERYSVTRLISEKPRSRIYAGKDRLQEDRKVIIKEVEFGDFSPDDLRVRVELFSATIDSLIQYDHPNLSKVFEQFEHEGRYYVIMERVDGLTMDKLIQMSVKELPESQVIDWMTQVADALLYLHDRPTPFIFDVLDPTHIIIDEAGQLKLINYGLDRFSDPASDPKPFSGHIDEIAQEMARFGETLYFFLTRQPCKAEEMQWASYPEHISPGVQKVLKRCFIPQAERTYANFEALRADLKKALLPPEEAPEPGEVVIPTRPPTAFGKFMEFIRLQILFPLFSQNIFLFIGEILLVVLIGTGLYLWTHPGLLYFKRGPQAYVICNDKELWTIDRKSHQVLSRQVLEHRLGDVLSDGKGSTVYYSLPQLSQVMAMDTLRHQVFTPIRVDRDPGHLFWQEPDRTLMVIGSKTCNVAMINIAKKRMYRLLAVSKDPRDGIPVVKGSMVAVANTGNDTVMLLDPNRREVMQVFKLDGGPRALAVNDKTSMLYVALQDLNRVVEINLVKMAPGRPLVALGGTRPVALHLERDPKGDKLYVLNSLSDNIGVIDIKTGNLNDTIPVGRRPAAWAAAPERETSRLLWVADFGGDTITLVDMGIDQTRGEIKVGRNPSAICLTP